MKVKIVNKSPWPDPSYATEASAGMDLRACIEEPLLLRPLERALVPTGIFIELPSASKPRSVRAAALRPSAGSP